MTGGPFTAPHANATLGRYRLLLELGHGGMAHVYLAHATGLAGFSKLVVLKVMRDELREHPASLAMFLGEARLAARMNHPNVVHTSEVGEQDGRYFICMEYLEGQTLGRVLRKTIDAALPLGARLELMCQLLEGLAYLHEFKDLDGTALGLVHRDISPNNVFITYDGSVKVLDFGVAKAAGISHVTEAGTFKGKLGYAAPEQIVGRSDQRSDVFAAGVLFWELLTYRRLTQNRTQTEIVQGRIAGAEWDLMQLDTGLPAELLDICSKAAAKVPEDRYQTASAMRDAIRAYVTLHGLAFPSEKLRDMLGRLYETERDERRKQIDHRIKQVQLEDDHPSQFSQAHLVPNASAVFGQVSPDTTSTAVAPTGSRRRGIWIGVLALLAASAATATLLRNQSSSQPAALPTASAIGAVAPAARSEPALVTLSLSASPATAELFLDDAKLDGNPFEGQLPADAALHRLEARAVGFRSEARMVGLDRSLTLELQLSALPASVAPAALRKGGRAAGEGSSASRGITDKSRPPKDARPIDNADPYAP